MLRLPWVGILGAYLLLGCGMTTREDDEPQPTSSPTGGSAPSAAGSSNPVGNGEPGASTGGSSSTPEPIEEPPDPAVAERIDRLIQALGEAREARAHCYEGHEVPPLYYWDPEMEFFSGDVSAGAPLDQLATCLHEFPNQASIVPLLDWWWIRIEEARTCWLASSCDVLPVGACYIEGCSTGTVCKDNREVTIIASCALEER